MKLQAVFLDGAPAQERGLQANVGPRNLLIQASLVSFQDEKSFLVSNSDRSNLVESGILKAQNQVNVISPTGPTRGALASALLPIDFLSDSDPIVVIPTNSVTHDGVLREFIDQMFNDKVAAGIILIESTNPHFSYARVHEGKVIEIIEKCIVGNLATTGVFYFRNKKVLKECARWAFVNNQSTDDKFFIAPSLNYVLSTGEEIGYVIVDSSNYQHFAW